MVQEMTRGISFEECSVCERSGAESITHIAATALVVGQLAIGEATIPSRKRVTYWYDNAVRAVNVAVLRVSAEYFNRMHHSSGDDHVLYTETAMQLHAMGEELRMSSDGLYDCAQTQMQTAVQELGLGYENN